MLIILHSNYCEQSSEWRWCRFDVSRSQLTRECRISNRIVSYVYCCCPCCCQSNIYTYCVGTNFGQFLRYLLLSMVQTHHHIFEYTIVTLLVRYLLTKYLGDLLLRHKTDLVYRHDRSLKYEIIPKVETVDTVVGEKYILYRTQKWTLLQYIYIARNPRWRGIGHFVLLSIARMYCSLVPLIFQYPENVGDMKLTDKRSETEEEAQLDISYINYDCAVCFLPTAKQCIIKRLLVSQLK